MTRQIATLAPLALMAACATPDAERSAVADVVETTAKAHDRTTIADIAMASDDFTILVAALDAAGLVDTFDGKRQFTVFAPTDDAFIDLLDELDVSAEELLADTETLTAVLTYHVAPGRRYAETVVASDRIRTINGDFAWISVEDGAAYIDDAQIIATDIEADNGIIHVIDRVIIPD